MELAQIAGELARLDGLVYSLEREVAVLDLELAARFTLRDQAITSLFGDFGGESGSAGWQATLNNTNAIDSALAGY